MLQNLFNAVFLKTCAGCQSECDDFFCVNCHGKINFLKDKGCKRCAEFHGPYLRPETCNSCKHKEWKLKKVIALASFESPLREAVLQLKYGGWAYGAREMSHKLGELIEPGDFDIICPVPNPLIRQLKRGYNQAELLARGLHKETALPLLAALKCRWKPSQLSFNAEKRRFASSENYRVVKNVTDKRIALVDDVLTTGGTANACAGALLEAGAAEVTAVVIGRRLKKC